jgi:hypothetical protein
MKHVNAPPVHYYMDDSGTRKLDRVPTLLDLKRPNHFALGGILILEEDETAVRAAHARLCEKWGITYPLHSVDMRAGARDFSCQFIRAVRGTYAGPFSQLPSNVLPNTQGH